MSPWINIQASHSNETVFKLIEGNRYLDQGKTPQAAPLIDSLKFYSYQPLKKYQSILKARALLQNSRRRQFYI